MLVTYFVVLPIVQAKMRQGQWANPETNHRANELVERKENIYAAIKELEFDYQMGKLSEEDFQELRQQYKQEAVGLLKKIDKIQSKKRQFSKGKSAQKRGDSSIKYCWICGLAVTELDRFCANCGTNLIQE